MMGFYLVPVVFFGLLALGMPVGITIGVAGMVGILDMGPRFMSMAPDRIFAGLDLFPFLAMPFFILAGEIMNRSGITAGLVKLADALVGWLRGGMAHSNMVASVMFAGITGSATADAAAFGNTLVPAMERAGYKSSYACAVTAAGSIIGPTIPPSTLAIIYGSIMGVSIAGLFAAGILPGLLICVVCMTVIAFTAKRKGLPKGDQRPSLKVVVTALREGILAILLPVFILGSILFGLATPTEAAAIAVAYALFVGGVIYRALTWRPFQHLEKRYFEKEDLGFPVFDSLDAKIGMCICNDRRWPETWRMLGLGGAELVLLGYNTPAHYPPAPEHDNLQYFHNELCVQAGAYQNGLWAISVAKAGMEEGCELIGGSLIVAPTGEILARAATQADEVITCAIDLDRCTEIRRNIFDFSQHRQPAEYAALAE